MASSLCNISSSWSFDRSPSCVTKFTYLDLTATNRDTAGQAHPTFDRIAEDVDSNSQDQIWFTQLGSNESSEHCIIDFACPNPDFSQINGIFIVSESRTLEISNSTKGYLTTLRGKKIINRSETSNGVSTVTLYSSICQFEESYPSLSIKFLSLGERKSFCVQNIRINMLQHGLQSSKGNGTLNVDKLKKDIEDMGNTMSERAKDFMTTLEQYEKNKLSKMNSLVGTQVADNQKGNNGLSSIMNSILGAKTMKSLSSPGIGSDGGDKPDLFSILNSVCGSVASLRVAETNKKESGETANLNVAKVDSCVTNEGNDDQHLSPQNLELLTEKVEELKSDMREELSEMRLEILTKVEDVKSELNQKLDMVLTLLRNLQPVQGNT